MAHIQAPTLVEHNENNALIPLAQGAYLADHITGSQFAVFRDSSDASGIADYDRFLDEIAAFVGGERPAVEVDRILTTVLFTDIVESTGQLAAVGDRQMQRSTGTTTLCETRCVASVAGR